MHFLPDSQNLNLLGTKGELLLENLLQHFDGSEALQAFEDFIYYKDELHKNEISLLKDQHAKAMVCNGYG